jgi:hypothetical protein
VQADLEKKFEQALLTAYLRAKKEAKYHASVFYSMLNSRGGLSTAKFLINSPQVSDGYTELHLRKRLDLTVEAIVAENKIWHELFSADELEKARSRLRKYQYQWTER